eukprot:COSAG06_NODE_20472_length_794_cov_1.106475_1_plen_211_part_01
MTRWSCALSRACSNRNASLLAEQKFEDLTDATKVERAATSAANEQTVAEVAQQAGIDISQLDLAAGGDPSVWEKDNTHRRDDDDEVGGVQAAADQSVEEETEEAEPEAEQAAEPEAEPEAEQEEEPEAEAQAEPEAQAEAEAEPGFSYKLSYEQYPLLAGLASMTKTNMTAFGVKFGMDESKKKLISPKLAQEVMLHVPLIPVQSGIQVIF